MDVSKVIGCNRAVSRAFLVALVAFCGPAYADDAWQNTRCKVFKAYGGYRDTETGVGTGVLTGESFHCKNGAVAGAGFKTDAYQVIVHSCLKEKYCLQAGVEPGIPFVTVSRNGIKGNFFAKGEILEASPTRMQVKELDSTVIYSWVDGQEIIEPGNFSLISYQP